jgi:hypothetical protein
MSMVILDFEPNEPELARSLAGRADLADLDRLRDGFFVFPIRFQLGGVDLLASVDSVGETFVPWLPAPIVDRAIASLIAVDEAWDGSVVEDDPDEYGASLIWRRCGDAIEVESALGAPTIETSASILPCGRAPYAELRAACLAFGAKVRTYLLDALPALADHPEAGTWFRGEVEVPETYLADLAR